jgi:hypothetical protein
MHDNMCRALCIFYVKDIFWSPTIWDYKHHLSRVRSCSQFEAAERLAGTSAPPRPPVFTARRRVYNGLPIFRRLRDADKPSESRVVSRYDFASPWNRRVHRRRACV